MRTVFYGQHAYEGVFETATRVRFRITDPPSALVWVVVETKKNLARAKNKEYVPADIEIDERRAEGGRTFLGRMAGADDDNDPSDPCMGAIYLAQKMGFTSPPDKCDPSRPYTYISVVDWKADNTFARRYHGFHGKILDEFTDTNGIKKSLVLVSHGYVEKVDFPEYTALWLPLGDPVNVDAYTPAGLTAIRNIGDEGAIFIEHQFAKDNLLAVPNIIKNPPKKGSGDTNL